MVATGRRMAGPRIGGPAIWAAWVLLVGVLTGKWLVARWPQVLDALKFPAVLAPDPVAHWAGAVHALGWVGLFGLAAIAAGRALARFIGLVETPFERIPVRVLVGMAVHAGVALGFGLTGLLYPAVAMLGVGWLIVVARPGRLRPLAGGGASLSMLGRTCRVIAIGAGGVLVLWSLAPQWFVDTLAYHLAAPAHFNKLHRWTDMPHSTYRYTLLAEHLFGQTLLIGGEVLASLMHAATGFVIAWLGWAWAARVAGPAAGWLTAASLIACLPIGVILKHDVFSVAFASLAVWAAVGRAGTSRAFFLLAGAAAGWSFCAKYTAGAIAAGIAVGTLALGRTHGGASRLRPGVVGFAMVSLPWLVKAWLFTGNPVFSFVFDGVKWNDENTAAVAAFGCPGYSWSPLDPGGVARALLAMLARDLPLVLLAFPALLMPMREHRPALVVLGVSAALLVVGAPCERLLAPVVPLATVLAAVHFAGHLRERSGVAAVAGGWVPAVLILAAGAGAHGSLSFGHRPLAAALGLESRSVFQSRVLTTHARAARQLEEIIPDGDRLLVVGDSRGYLFRQIAITRDITDTPLALRLARRSGDAERIMVRFRQRRIRYVLLNYVSAEYRGYFKGPIFRWKPGELQRFWTFWRRHSTRVPFDSGEDGENGGFVLYRIHTEPRRDDRALAFLPGATSAGLRWPEEDYGAALKRLEGVVETAPGVVFFELNYCRLLLEAGRYDEVERRLGPCLQAPFPRMDQVHAVLGLALLGQGALARGREHFRIAHDLKPLERSYLSMLTATQWSGAF